MEAGIFDFCIILTKLFPQSKLVSVFYVYLGAIFIHDMKYENTFKAIDQILWKEQGCGSELDYLEHINNGFKELGADKLKTFITIKFNSMSDAKERLQMSVADIRAHYFELQRRLYCA